MDYSISGENEAREEVFLTESNKSPGSITKSNNQGNLLASGEVQVPSDKLRSTHLFGYEQVVKRMLLSA